MARRNFKSLASASGDELVNSLNVEDTKSNLTTQIADNLDSDINQAKEESTVAEKKETKEKSSTTKTSSKTKSATVTKEKSSSKGLVKKQKVESKSEHLSLIVTKKAKDNLMKYMEEYGYSKYNSFVNDLLEHLGDYLD